MPPTPWSCLEDQLRVHTEGLGLEKSPVQITGLEGLLLPPVTASRPEGGPAARFWVASWRGKSSAPGGPSGVLERLTDRKATGPQKGKSLHSRGVNGPVPLGPWQEGVQGPEEMQTALSQSPWPLEPETRTLLPKIAHPKCGQPPPNFPRSPWE